MTKNFLAIDWQGRKHACATRASAERQAGASGKVVAKNPSSGAKQRARGVRGSMSTAMTGQKKYMEGGYSRGALHEQSMGDAAEYRKGKVAGEKYHSTHDVYLTGARENRPRLPNPATPGAAFALGSSAGKLGINAPLFDQNFQFLLMPFTAPGGAAHNKQMFDAWKAGHDSVPERNPKRNPDYSNATWLPPAQRKAANDAYWREEIAYSRAANYLVEGDCDAAKLSAGAAFEAGGDLNVALGLKENAQSYYAKAKRLLKPGKSQGRLLNGSGNYIPGRGKVFFEPDGDVSIGGYKIGEIQKAPGGYVAREISDDYISGKKRIKEATFKSLSAARQWVMIESNGGHPLRNPGGKRQRERGVRKFQSHEGAQAEAYRQGAAEVRWTKGPIGETLTPAQRKAEHAYMLAIARYKQQPTVAGSHIEQKIKTGVLGKLPKKPPYPQRNPAKPKLARHKPLKGK